MKKILAWLLCSCLILGDGALIQAELLSDGSETTATGTDAADFSTATGGNLPDTSAEESDTVLIESDPAAAGEGTSPEAEADSSDGSTTTDGSVAVDGANTTDGSNASNEADSSNGSGTVNGTEETDGTISIDAYNGTTGTGTTNATEGEDADEELLISEDTEEDEESEDLLTAGEEDSKVNITRDNFPDNNVYNLVLTFDTDGDQYLSEEEIAAVTELHLSSLDYGRRTTSTTGLEYFTNVTWLDLSYNTFTELDLSVFPNLVYLNCSRNNLTTLDISGNPNLERLYCNKNSLTSLNLQGAENLILLNCNENQLRSLSMQNTPNLKWFSCEYNSLTYLNVTGLSSLLSLDCASNSLTTLSVRGLKKLSSLTVDRNNLTALDLRDQTGLTIFSCQKNSISSLNLRYCTGLTYLDCSENRLTALDVSANTSLVTLDVRTNLMTAMSAVKGRASTITTFYYYNQRENDTLKTDVTSLTNMSTGVQVRWNKASGASKYWIYRKTSEDNWGAWSYLATVSNPNQTSYLDTDVTSGVTYKYRVRAADVNTSEYTVDYVGMAIQYLSMPKFTASTNRPTGIYLRWTKSEGASGYRVYRRTEGGDWVSIAVLSGSDQVEYTDTSVSEKNGSFYYYTVRAYGPTGGSAYAATGRMTCRLRKPGMSVYKPLTGNRAGFSWSINGAATGYYVQYSTDASFKNAVTVTMKGYKKNSCVVKNLKANTRYYVRVQAYRIQDGKEFKSALSGTRSFVTY